MMTLKKQCLGIKINYGSIFPVMVNTQFFCIKLSLQAFHLLCWWTFLAVWLLVWDVITSPEVHFCFHKFDWKSRTPTCFGCWILILRSSSVCSEWHPKNPYPNHARGKSVQTVISSFPHGIGFRTRSCRKYGKNRSKYLN